MNKKNIIEFAHSVGKLSDIEYMRAKELIEAESRVCNCNCEKGAYCEQYG